MSAALTTTDRRRAFGVRRNRDTAVVMIDPLRALLAKPFHNRLV